MGAIKELGGISEVLDEYEGFIFDLWGVTHNGIVPFKDVVRTFSNLKAAGKKVCFLSNSPNRAIDNVNKINSMGISPDKYDAMITSGEVAWKAINDNLCHQWGDKYLALCSGSYSSFMNDFDFKSVSNVGEANFILNGESPSQSELNRYKKEFEKYIELGLPMLCTNPDKIVCVGDSFGLCPGILAENYEQMGGKVKYFGKPYKEVYDECFKIMNTNNVLAVGDNMDTDIRGANSAGIDSILVRSGVHKSNLSEQNRSSFLKAYSAKPTYIMDEVLWS